MPDIQIDRAHLAASILPADIPELSDDHAWPVSRAPSRPPIRHGWTKWRP